MKTLVCLLFCSRLLVPAALAGDYAFPVTNRYAATILGAPPEMQAELPADVPVVVDQVTIFPERKVPEVLWLSASLSYVLSPQPGPAPLAFVIAGSGANHLAPKSELLRKVLYQAGYHVVGLPSPTHPNFLVAASSSGTPGLLAEDAADLYRAMQLIRDRLAGKLDIRGYALVGYSLGGAQAAYVASLDDRQQLFRFDKVLMINPPLNLVGSVERLDRMLEDNVPGGLNRVDRVIDQIFDNLTEVYRRGDFVDLNNQFLYAAYREGSTDDATLQAIIGADFRFSCTNLAFSADLLNRAGYVVPRGRRLTRSDSLAEYLKVLNRLSYADYIDGLLLPRYRQSEPSLRRAEIVERTDLRGIEAYLRSATKIGLMHNADDIILGPGEIDWFRAVFAERAVIYPTGGHCGNLDYRDNVAEILRFFRE